MKAFPARFALAMALALHAVPPAGAQTADETAAEVKRLLTTLAPTPSGEGRSVIVIRRPVTIVVDSGPVTVDYGYSAEVEVQFEFDSARLTRRATRTLAALGRALGSGELAGFDYLIAGHTDAKGSASYNRRLSYERAMAVRDFLVRNFAIHPRRLHVIGWGESRLKTPHDPLAAVNRRVEVTLIVPRRPATPIPPISRSEDSGGIRIVPRSEERGDIDGEAEVRIDREMTDLPPCPTGRLGDPRDPTADLDDFGPRPGIDCMPPEGASVRISPEGRITID